MKTTWPRSNVSGITQLEHNRLSKTYQSRLRRALKFMLDWSISMCIDMPTGEDPAYTAEILVQFVQWCHDNAINIWVPKHAVLAFRNFVPGLRQALHRPWDALRAWGASLPLSHRIPLPEIVLQAIFGYMLNHALEFTSVAHRWVSAAVLFRIGFNALLRPGEFSSLRARDVKVVSPLGMPAVALVAIASPKNKHAMGRAQFVCIRDQALVAWIQWLTHNLPRNCKLWPGSHTQLVSLWKKVIACLGCGDVGFTLGSLRPGGTTQYYIMGKEIAYIKHLGRWASETSMTCYIQEAMASLVWSKICPVAESQISSWSSASKFAWDSPPKVPWQNVFSRKRQMFMMSLSRKKSASKNSCLHSRKLANTKLQGPHLNKDAPCFQMLLH
jgi:hypothetical protein